MVELIDARHIASEAVPARVDHDRRSGRSPPAVEVGDPPQELEQVGGRRGGQAAPSARSCDTDRTSAKLIIAIYSCHCATKSHDHRKFYV